MQHNQFIQSVAWPGDSLELSQAPEAAGAACETTWSIIRQQLNCSATLPFEGTSYMRKLKAGYSLALDE